MSEPLVDKKVVAFNQAECELWDQINATPDNVRLLGELTLKAIEVMEKFDCSIDISFHEPLMDIDGKPIRRVSAELPDELKARLIG